MDEMKTTVRTLTFSTNYVTRSPLPRKVGVMTPPPSSYGSAALGHERTSTMFWLFMNK